MSTDEHKLLQLIREEIKEGIEGFRLDVRNGFQETNARLDQTISRLDETNCRLDQTISRLDETNCRLDQTISGLDQTNVRLEAAITMTRDFRKDVSQKLDQIGGYLGLIDGQALKHEERIQSLETRMDRLEQTG